MPKFNLFRSPKRTALRLPAETLETAAILKENNELCRSILNIVKAGSAPPDGNVRPDERASESNGVFYFDPDGIVSKVVVNPDVHCGTLAKQILRLMAPMDVADGQYVRVGNDFDGGYVMLDSHLHDTVAYSFGINDDVSWDQGMVDRGCHIYQFDHTIDALPYENDHFHWQKRGISSETKGEFISVSDIISNNGHRDRNDIILKMDIEGFEWPVFESLSESDLNKFSQIVVELHSFVTGGKEHLERVIPILEKINKTHQSVHFHANNWSWLGITGGVTLPDVFELTYVRKIDHSFRTCTREFPTPLDRPCRRDAPDYFLHV
jgi:hypothetical protein